MAYDPNAYIPTRSWSQPMKGLVRIESIDAARVYFLPPSSVSPPLFLSDENAFIIKTTDDIGMASLKKYRFEEIPIEDEHSSEEFITREYFDRRINEIMEVINGQYTVSEQSTSEQPSQFNLEPPRNA